MKPLQLNAAIWIGLMCAIAPSPSQAHHPSDHILHKLPAANTPPQPTTRPANASQAEASKLPLAKFSSAATQTEPSKSAAQQQSVWGLTARVGYQIQHTRLQPQQLHIHRSYLAAGFTVHRSTQRSWLWEVELPWLYARGDSVQSSLSNPEMRLMMVQKLGHHDRWSLTLSPSLSPGLNGNNHLQESHWGVGLLASVVYHSANRWRLASTLWSAISLNNQNHVPAKSPRHATDEHTPIPATSDPADNWDGYWVHPHTRVEVGGQLRWFYRMHSNFETAIGVDVQSAIRQSGYAIADVYLPLVLQVYPTQNIAITFDFKTAVVPDSRHLYRAGTSIMIHW